MPTCEELTSRLLDHFTSDTYRQELLNAKKDFFEQAGIIDDETNQFESRMSQFLDWYLFTRDLEIYQLPPAQLILQKNLIPMTDEERELFLQISQTRHSLFEFIKVRGHDVYIRDLFNKQKVILKSSNIRVGFNPDEIFDARIIPFGDIFEFSKGFCFHPVEAKKFILKEIKKIRHLQSQQHEELMFRLLKMRYKLEQYKHIRLEFIYTNDPQIKL